MGLGWSVISLHQQADRLRITSESAADPGGEATTLDRLALVEVVLLALFLVAVAWVLTRRHGFIRRLENRASTDDVGVRFAAALRRGELEVHYQPIVELDSGLVVSVEGLLRWRDPQRGLVPPDEFVPLIEQTALIVELGTYVLRTGCAQLAEWRRAGSVSPRLRLNINVSASQLEHPGFADEVVACLRATGVAPDRLILELSEGQLIRDIDWSVRSLDRLRSLGIRVAVDHFGTASSALGYLEKLPAAMLKIDRSFISGDPVPGDPGEGGVLLRSMVDLGAALGAEVVAEGVETTEQRAALRAIGCRYGQGFLFAPPLPAAEVTAVISQRLAAGTS
jgi:EAL domain-containing protein (putative c-di-GMP-specific phosphodiesterase class I)